MKQRNAVLWALIAVAVVFFISCNPASENKGNNSDMLSEQIDLSVDMGGEPWALDIEEATLNNKDYRVANWTGKYMQLVFMTLKPGEIIDLEKHDGHDQFIRIEAGDAQVLMGLSPDNLTYDQVVSDDWAIMIPAGYWHQIINTGDSDLKLYTLYGPPEHAKGTRNASYQDAKESDEHDH
jgi:mannose-6-phosphate isomerase-like protein (cupin superfamily)